MGDAAQPWNDEPASPKPAESAVVAPVSDPLGGDWSEGLQGAPRDHGLPVPERVQLSQTPVSAPPPAPRRSAEELVAEAAGKLSPESVRTERASAAAIFAEPEKRVIVDEPSIIVSDAVHVEVSPTPTGYTDRDAKPLSPSEIHTETIPAPELPPLDADLANDLRRALVADDPALPRLATPTRPQEAWALLDQIAPRGRLPAPPVPGGAKPTPVPAEPPSASAAAEEDPWASPPPPSPAKDAPVPLPGSFLLSEATTLEADRQRGFTPPPGDEDLPVPVVESVPGQPEFLFGEPRVVVHTLAGRVKRGTLRSTDLGQPELRLLHPAGGGEERINISEVKAVFFMLEPGKHPPASPGGRVRVTLSDGRMLEGFRESDGPSGGLFIVPLDASRTNTRAIFVCGDAIQNVDQA